MKYKIGDKVIIIKDYDDWDCIKEHRKGKDFKKEIGRIIYTEPFGGYDIEIVNCPYKKECEKLKKKNYCGFWDDFEIKSISSLKLKKFIEHGV